MESHCKFPALEQNKPDQPMNPLELPLIQDDSTMPPMKMVFQKCPSCIRQQMKNGEERFVEMCGDMAPEELSKALLVKPGDLINHLQHEIACVGCRQSVERLLMQLAGSQNPAVEPLMILRTAELTVVPSYLRDLDALTQLLNFHGMDKISDSILKNKKNKRCILHSLETHKSKTTGVCHAVWMEVWEAMSKECKKLFTQIPSSSFSNTLESYLRKHRFCAECKSKVQLAYHLLIGEKEKTEEKTFSTQLFSRVVPVVVGKDERHIHIQPDTDYINELITKAEPELMGNSRRDRHAKTLDIAQEEVLTCLGVHLYERLYGLWQKVKTQNQTWTILFNLGVDCLRKSVRITQELKRGISNLELTCQAMIEEERQKEHKLEMKRLKKKKKKSSKNAENENIAAEEQSVCQHSSSNGQPLQSWSSNCENKVCRVDETKCASCENFQAGEGLKTSGPLPPHLTADFGYASGPDGCESCSMPSSNEGSDIACSEGICTHDGESCSGNCLDTFETCETCLEDDNSSKWHGSDLDNCASSHCTNCHNKGSTRSAQSLNLLTYYQKICHCPLEDERDKDGDSISEEDIRLFKETHGQHQRQRQALRDTLRQRFENLQHKKSRPNINSHSVLS